MTMQYRVIVAGSLDAAQKERVKKMINEVFTEVDQVYNKWNVDSEISAFNAHALPFPFIMSEKLATFIRLTDLSVKLTGGRFDPTIEPVQKLWKAALEQKKLPNQEDVDALKKTTGWEKLWIFERALLKKTGSLKVDFGGNAKGYAVDLCVEALNENGWKDVYVEWGGEMRASGSHPAGRPWRVFISNLGNPDPGQAIAMVDLENQALATSGDYHQFWEIAENEVYTHIFDPKTFKPLKMSPSSISSASVLAPTCQLADTLATSAMLFETAEDAKLWAENLTRKLPGVAFWIVTTNKETLYIHERP